MPKKKKQTSGNWLIIGFMSILMTAPNATVLRVGVLHDNVFLFNALRFASIAVICLPFVLLYLRRFTRRNRRFVTITAVLWAVSALANILAIKFGSASYVSIISLLSPIAMVFLSMRLVGDKITPRALAGISLAATGAITIILLPIAIHQGGHFLFYPLSTVFALINAVTYPLSVIYLRKANESGVPFMPLLGVSAIVVMAASFVLFFVCDGGTDIDWHGQIWWAILYSGLVNALLARMLNTACYQHTSATTIAVLNYFGILLAVLIPVVWLGEQLSMTMIVGGALMLAGLYVVQHHKFKRHQYFHLHTRH